MLFVYLILLILLVDLGRSVDSEEPADVDYNRVRELLMDDGLFPTPENCRKQVDVSRTFFTLIKDHEEREEMLKKRKDMFLEKITKDMPEEEASKYCKKILRIFTDKLFTFAEGSKKVCSFVEAIHRNNFEIPKGTRTHYDTIEGEKPGMKFKAEIYKTYDGDEEGDL